MIIVHREPFEQWSSSTTSLARPRLPGGVEISWLPGAVGAGRWGVQWATYLGFGDPHSLSTSGDTITAISGWDRGDTVYVREIADGSAAALSRAGAVLPLGLGGGAAAWRGNR